VGGEKGAMRTLQDLLRSEDPFYRMRLSYGAFIGRRYPYVFIETPKAACTTTKVVLWRLEGLGPVPPDLTMVHHRSPWDPRKSPLTVPEEEALKALGGASAPRFFVWRDPVERLRSAYWDKIRLGYDYSPEWEQWRVVIRNAFRMPADQEISFDRFAEFVCALPDHLRDPHFMSQRRLVLADFVTYDYVVRTDDYAAGMAEVLRAMGVPHDRWPPLDERRNETGSSVVPVSAATAAKIRSAFSAAYDLLDVATREHRATR
jgi:hypothetical protein